MELQFGHCKRALKASHGGQNHGIYLLAAASAKEAGSAEGRKCRGREVQRAGTSSFLSMCPVTVGFGRSSTVVAI